MLPVPPVLPVVMPQGRRVARLGRNVASVVMLLLLLLLLHGVAVVVARAGRSQRVRRGGRPS